MPGPGDIDHLVHSAGIEPHESPEIESARILNGPLAKIRSLWHKHVYGNMFGPRRERLFAMTECNQSSFEFASHFSRWRRLEQAVPQPDRWPKPSIWTTRRTRVM
jgi:hypothetical protein